MLGAGAARGARQDVDDRARAQAAHALVVGGALDLRDLGQLPVADLLAVVELHLLDGAEVLVLLDAREHRHHRRRAQRVRRDVQIVARSRAGQQLAVDLLLVGDAHVVRHGDADQAVLERLVLLVGHEGPELGLVRVRHDHRVGVDVAELGDLELLLLRHRQEQVAELRRVLEELDGLEEPAVGLRELAGPVERERVRVRAVRLDRLEVQAAGQLLHAHRLRVARLERADAHAAAPPRTRSARSGSAGSRGRTRGPASTGRPGTARPGPAPRCARAPAHAAPSGIRCSGSSCIGQPWSA